MTLYMAFNDAAGEGAVFKQRIEAMKAAGKRKLGFMHSTLAGNFREAYPKGNRVIQIPDVSNPGKLEETKMINNYAPTVPGAVHRFKITLMQQSDYTAAFEVEVNGNSRGMSLFNAAVSILYEQLPSIQQFDHEIALVILTNPEGEKLECTDDEQCSEDWLSDMVIGIETIDHQPELKPRSREGEK